MYKQTEWKDHVVQYPRRRKIVDNGDGTSDLEKAEGEVYQQGTPQSATNFNNLEDGVQDASVATAILGWGNLQQQRQNEAEASRMNSETLGETKTVTLKNTANYPFNSSVDSPTSVALTTTRKSLYYTVEAEVTDHTGEVGEIHITDKALNGFKVSFDGRGTSATVILRIKGGMA